METNSLISRLIRIVRLDPSIYREVAADQNAMSQSLLTAGIAVLLNALGPLIAVILSQTNLLFGMVRALLDMTSGFVGFVLVSLSAALIAQMLFQGKTTFQEMMRTLGFAYIWNSLGLLAFIPILGDLIQLGARIVVVVSIVLALRESAEFDLTKATVTAIIAGAVALFVYICVTGVIGASLLRALGFSIPA